MRLRHNFLALMLGTLLLVPLRTYQLFFSIDPETGFYVSSDIFVLIFTVILIAIVAFQIVAGFLAKVKEREWRDLDGPVLGVLSFVLGATFFVMSVFYFLPENAGGSLRALFFAPPAGEQAVNRPDFMLNIQGIFGLASGVLFLFIGYNCFVRRKIKTPAVLALSPVIWSCVRLAYSFMGFTSIANMSEHLFDVMMLVFTTLFFYYFARYLSDMDRQKAVNKLFAFGSPAVIFCFLCTIPRYIRLMVETNEDANFFMGFPSLFNLIAPMFFIAVLLFVLTIRVSENGFAGDVDGGDIGFEFEAPIMVNRFVTDDGLQDEEEYIEEDTGGYLDDGDNGEDSFDGE